MAKNYFTPFKNYLFALVVMLITQTAMAQTITYPTGNPQGLNAPWPYGVTAGHTRTQMVYEEGPSELNIPVGSIITSISFYLSDTLNPPNLSFPVKIYMREVPYSVLTPSNIIIFPSPSNLVYSGDMTPADWAFPPHWVTRTLTFASPLITTGSNLEIYIETDWQFYNTCCGWLQPGYPDNIVFSQHYKSSGVLWGGDTVKCMRPNIQLTYVSATPCAGSPPAINAATSMNPACFAPFQLSANGFPPQSGFSFQWFSSFVSGVGPFSPIIGATTPIVQVTQSQQTWYYCSYTCSIGGATTNSNVIAVGQSLTSNCYCYSAAINSSDADIGQVTFATMSNGSCTPILNNSAATAAYTDNTQTVAIPNVQQGLTYPISMCQVTSGSTWYPGYFNAFIDYNRDGIFDPVLERVFSAGPTTSANSSASGTVTIPYNAYLGRTRLRVILVEGGNNLQSPCGVYNSGETEDFDINLIPGVPCSGPVIPGIAVSSTTNVCCAENFTLSVDSNTSAGSGQTFQWQSSNTGCGGPWSNITGANTPTYVANQFDTTWYQCIITCSSGTPAYTTCVQVNFNPPALCPGIITNLHQTTNNNIQTMSLQPNPASTKVRVNYSLAKQSNADVSVFDITGKEVMRQKLGNNTSGNNTTVVDISKLNNGFYTIRLNSTDAFTVEQLMVIH